MKYSFWIVAVGFPDGYDMMPRTAQNQAEALDILRKQYANGRYVADEALIEFVESKGLKVYMQRHNVEVRGTVRRGTSF